METLQTTLPETKQAFPNLAKAIKKEETKQLKKFIEEINEIGTTAEILDKWYYRELIPKGKNVLKFAFNDLKAYLIERKTKKVNASIDKQLQRLNTINNADELISVDISIEWKKSRMWGSNPRANASIHTVNGWNRYESGSIGGCGYDKESTAVAEVLNQCNAMLKALYTVKENNINNGNRDLFGYGSGYGILPYLEGGVGVSCYPKIFSTIGYEFKSVASGKTFDVYSISKVVK